MFRIGLTEASTNIVINNDSLTEDDETFSISITSITNDHAVGTPGVATVTIVDSTGKCMI